MIVVDFDFGANELHVRHIVYCRRDILDWDMEVLSLIELLPSECLIESFMSQGEKYANVYLVTSP